MNEFQKAYADYSDNVLPDVELVSRLNLPTSYNRWLYEVITPRLQSQVGLMTGFNAALVRVYPDVEGNSPHNLKAAIKIHSLKLIVDRPDVLNVVQLHPYGDLMSPMQYDWFMDGIRHMSKLHHIFRSGMYEIAYADYLIPTMEQYFVGRVRVDLVSAFD